MNEDKRELAELLERHAREMAAHFLGHVNSIQDAALSKLLRTASEALTAVGAHLRARREEGRLEPVRSEAVTLRFPSDPDADKYVVTHHEPSLHGAPPVGAAGLTLKLKTGSTWLEAVKSRLQECYVPRLQGRDVLDRRPRRPGYTCSACNIAAESFRAIDNVPNHAHLCKECARLLPEPIMAHYFRIETKVPDIKVES